MTKRELIIHLIDKKRTNYPFNDKKRTVGLYNDKKRTVGLYNDKREQNLREVVVCERVNLNML